MNWLYDAYSNVYSTAMMQDVKPREHVAIAKGRADVKRSSLFGRIVRR